MLGAVMTAKTMTANITSLTGTVACATIRYA